MLKFICAQMSVSCKPDIGNAWKGSKLSWILSNRVDYRGQREAESQTEKQQSRTCNTGIRGVPSDGPGVEPGERGIFQGLLYWFARTL